MSQRADSLEGVMIDDLQEEKDTQYRYKTLLLC